MITGSMLPIKQIKLQFFLNQNIIPLNVDVPNDIEGELCLHTHTKPINIDDSPPFFLQ